MWKDPIVEEIHAIRTQIAIECNNDLGQIVERLTFSKPGKTTETQADG